MLIPASIRTPRPLLVALCILSVTLPLLSCDGTLLPATRFSMTCATAGCPCVQDADCKDEEVCTQDRCANQACVFDAMNDGASCDDGDGCTVSDQCQQSVCTGAARSCDDGNPCTLDACSAGACAFAVRVGGCDDGNSCTVDDSCKDGLCQAGKPRQLWQIVLPGAGDDHARGIAVAPEGGVYIAGFTLPAPKTWRARVLRLSASGAVVFDQVYPSGVSSQLYGATADGEGGVYAVGIWWVDQPNPTLENWRPVVIRIDASGKELWKQIDAKGGKLEPVVVLPGGDVLALGYEQFQPPSRPVAWRLAKDGGAEVERILLGSTGTRGRLYGAVVESDGSVLTVGRHGDDGPASDGLIARYGGKGDFKTVEALGESGVDDALRAVALDDHGLRFAVGRRQTSPSTPWLAVQKPGQSAIEASVLPPNKGGHAGLEAAARASKTVMVAGGSASTTGVDTVWWLAGVDTTGKRIWSRQGPTIVGGGASDVITDCVALPDGSVACTGLQTEVGKVGSHDVLVLRVDADGKSGCK